MDVIISLDANGTSQIYLDVEDLVIDVIAGNTFASFDFWDEDTQQVEQADYLMTEGYSLKVRKH